ncbi:hypothetical protein DPMN_109025 [Dreissena polymorpha]|uniref:Uncharacterized protein n=1 Tax=Dreissena polymorpha TaxID=45954 RepID=A0A9D4QMK1_DREPO|nr:hypothetical protein DPMN_109025 [Dreissena polymorpha]
MVEWPRRETFYSRTPGSEVDDIDTSEITHNSRIKLKLFFHYLVTLLRTTVIFLLIRTSTVFSKASNTT